MKFTPKQLEKISEQMRLASWAQGAIFYSDLHLFNRNVTIVVVICLWCFFQVIALYIDKGDE